MTLRQKGLVLAMEEDTIDAPSAEIDPQLPVEVEQGSQEVAEQVAEVEELNTAVEEAEADAETLGEIQETLAESVDAGEGVDETTAEVAEIAVEAICARLGIRSSSKVLPAMESFGSKSSRLTATRVAVESIGEKVKQIWEAIKKAFLSVWQKIKDFFAKFFTNTDKVKKLAEGLKEKAASVKGKKPETNKVKVSGAASAFNIDGKANITTAGVIMENHSNMTEQVLATTGLIQEAVSSLEAYAKGTGDDKGNLQGASKRVIESLTKGVKSEVKEDGGKLTGKVGPFVGGDFISFSLDTEAVTFSQEMVPASKAAPEQLDTLSPDDCSKICDFVRDLMTRTAEYKKQQTKFEALNKSMVNLVQAAIKVADKAADMSEENKTVKGHLDTARKAVTTMNSFSSRLITMTPAMNVRASKAALSYVSASLNEYKSEKKEGKK